MKRKYDKWHDFLGAYIPSNRKKYRKLSKLLGTPYMDNQQPSNFIKKFVPTSPGGNKFG